MVGESAMARYPSFSLPIHGVHEDRPRVPRLRARRLLERQQELLHRQLPAPRLLTPGLEAAIALVIAQSSGQCGGSGCWIIGRFADPRQEVPDSLGGLGPRPRRDQLLFGLGHEDRVAGQEPGEHQVAGRGRQRVELGLLFGGQGQGRAGRRGRRGGHRGRLGRGSTRGTRAKPRAGLLSGNKGRGAQLGGKFGLTASQPERTGGRRRTLLRINFSRGRHAARGELCRGGDPGRGLTPRARACSPQLNPSTDDPRPRARRNPPQGRPTGRTTSPPRAFYDRDTPPSSAAVPPPPTASRPPPTPSPCAPTSGPSPDASN